MPLEMHFYSFAECQNVSESSQIDAKISYFSALRVQRGIVPARLYIIFSFNKRDAASNLYMSFPQITKKDILLNSCP